MTSSQASWHADPLGWHQHRYWDGNSWTDHVANDGVQSVDSITRGPKPAIEPVIAAPDVRPSAAAWGAPTIDDSSNPTAESTPGSVAAEQANGALMDPVELLRWAAACEASGDEEGAIAAYREADEQGDAEASVLLGQALKRAGRTDPARAAFERGEARGHREAAMCLGNMLSDLGDAAGARAAYERGVAVGSTMAVLNLGLMLADAGEVEDALRYLQMARANGDPEAHWAVGKLLEGKGDLVGAAASYRAGADAGIASAAYGLGVVLEELGDRAGAKAAFQRADQLGHDGAKDVLAAIEREETSVSQDDGLARKLVEQLAGACNEVIGLYDSCVESSETVQRGQYVVSQPQAPSSRAAFQKLVERDRQAFLSDLSTLGAAQSRARGLFDQLQFVSGASDQTADKLVYPLLNRGVLRPEEFVVIAGIGGGLSKTAFGSTMEEFLEVSATVQELMRSHGK